MSTSSISVIPPANIEHGMDDDDELSEIKLEACQDISGRNISPVKLIAMLRTKFGIGSYEIQVCGILQRRILYSYLTLLCR